VPIPKSITAVKDIKTGEAYDPCPGLVVSSLWIFGCLVTFSGLACILGTFYDDEFFSITSALSYPHLVDYIKYINSTDIHPPVSYVLNKLSYDSLGNWKAIKFINGVVNAGAIAWFYKHAAKKVAPNERLALSFGLATAVTIELWGTSLRWNAYFNPVFLFLYTVALSERQSIITRAAILAVGSVFLFHTSYMTLVAAPVLWVTFVITSYRELQSIVIARRVALILLIAVIVCLPQAYVLLTMHLPYFFGTLMGGAPYSLSLLHSFLLSTASLTIGSAVFPIDFVPGFFVLMLAVASVSSARRMLRDNNVVVLLGGILLGYILVVVTGLGSDGRGAVFLYPIAMTLMVIAISRSALWIRWPAMASFVLLQIMSVYGFVMHRDTAKGSYNTPFQQAMHEIGHLTGMCPGSTIVLTHDPVLTYLMEDAGDKVLSPYETGVSETRVLREQDCVLIIHTYRGVFDTASSARFNRPLAPDDFRLSQTFNLGYDRFHMIKSWIAKEPFPEYYITIDTYGVLHDTSIRDWTE
jgi:hypothetical protein